MKMPVNKSLSERARKLRKNSTLSEVIFWNAVKNKQIFGLDFNRQKIIGNYIVDFYCAKLQLVIEIDGSSHDNKQGYDANRNRYLKSLGLDILHFHEQDIRFDINGAIEMLREYIENKLSCSFT